VTAALYRPRAALGALLVCAVALSLLSGCTVYQRIFHRGGRNFVGCTERPFAGSAESRATLKVPEGMSAPDTRNAVKIPELSTPDRNTGKTEPCLAQPPNFFAQPLPLEQTSKGKKQRKGTTPPTPTPTPAPAPAPAPATPTTAAPAPESPAAPPAPAIPATPAAPVPAAPAPVPPAATAPADAGPG
jgi:hypothetical protein